MLAPNVKALIKSHGHLSQQKHMASVRASIASSNNLLRHSAVRQVDEMGPAAAAAVKKILATP